MNTVKPYLIFANMVEREDFCKANMKNDRTTFHDVMNVIHIDEKWFYPKKKIYYLGIQESEPHWTAHSKRYCAKVMFLATVTCLDENHNKKAI